MAKSLEFNWIKKNWLKILFGLLTAVWIFALWFPIYWLVLSATKDPIESYKTPPSFVFVLPKDYTIYLDTTGLEGYTEEQFQYESAVLTWMLSDRKMNINLNSVTVVRYDGGNLMDWARLEYYTFTKHKSEIFIGNVSQERITRWKENGHEKYNSMLSFMQTGQGGKTIPATFPESGYIKTINEWWAKISDPNDQTLSEFEKISIRGQILAIEEKSNFGGLFRNFVSAWNFSDSVNYTFIKFIMNSLTVAVVHIILIIIVNGLAGYALSKLVPDKRLNRLIILYFVLVMAIPDIVKQVPLYTMIKRSSLNNNYWGIWLPAMFSPVNILLFKAYFDQIPNELLEASKIDGASEHSIFIRIMIPLAMPVFGSIAIMAFAGSWNSFFWPNLVLESTEKFTFPIIIQRAMSIETGGMRNYSVSLAMSVLASLPAIPIYAVMQKQLKEGLMLGGLKG